MITEKLADPGLFRQECFIQGKWVKSDTGKTIDVFNPATGERIGTVPKCGAQETRKAIESAEKCRFSWGAQTAAERSKLLRKWHDLLLENQEDLAVIMTLEQGKVLSESRGEIAYAAAFFEWFAEEAKRVYGDIIPQTVPSQRLVVLKQPIGVVAAITPWNFPSAMITRKAGAAMAAGCTMVVKPATATPYSALAIAELARRAGIPDGVFNVITGSSSAIGAELTKNPLVRKLTFTGSTAVGKKLMRDCSDTMKRVSMELGGNAPFIVFDDADLDSAIEGALISKFRNSGQTCVCANRFLVQTGVYEEFCRRLTLAVGKLKVGNGLEEENQQGPMIDMAAVEKIQTHVDDAISKNGRLMTGGQLHPIGGCFYTPTVIADASKEMFLSTEETFGPLAPVFKFSKEEEAIRLANDTPFGLAAYFYTRDLARTWRVSEKLEFGMVGINTGLISNPVAPFGGIKESGNGREGSKYGLDDYLEIKHLCMAGID